MAAALGSTTGSDVLEAFDIVGPTLRASGINGTISGAQADVLAADLRSGDFNAFVHRLSGYLGLDENDPRVASAFGITTSGDGGDPGGISADGIGAASPITPQMQITDLTMRKMVLRQALSKGERDAKAAAKEAGNLYGLGLGGFYGFGSVKGSNVDFDSYGMNLSASLETEKLEVMATLPIYRTSVGPLDFTTFGIDVGGQYNVFDKLNVGAHVNYLAYDSDVVTLESSWTAGPFVSYAIDFNERFSLSFGALFDRLAQESGPATWVAALAMNFGIKVTDAVAVNPFYVYYRDLDAVQFVDADWHDLGIDVSASINDKWSVNMGVKTSLGYDLFDHLTQVHLGTKFSF